MKSLFEKATEKILKNIGMKIRVKEKLPLEQLELSSKLIPDLLYLISYQIANASEDVLLYIEFQTKNETAMLERMGEYYF
ncbi:MAG: hypothetical protein ACTSRZ_03500 [Promethearchaeota archaeon]